MGHPNSMNLPVTYSGKSPHHLDKSVNVKTGKLYGISVCLAAWALPRQDCTSNPTPVFKHGLYKKQRIEWMRMANGDINPNKFPFIDHSIEAKQRLFVPSSITSMNYHHHLRLRCTVYLILFLRQQLIQLRCVGEFDLTKPVIV